MDLRFIRRSGLWCFLILQAYLAPCIAEVLSPLTPPPVQLTDRNSVNMMGSPTFMLTDLQIGSKELGLRHTIASYGGYFHGFTSNFSGSNFLIWRESGYRRLMNVNNGETSYLFDIDEQEGYLPLSDKGAAFIRNQDDYVLTDSSGTEFFFRATGTEDHAVGVMYKVVRANGYTINISRGLHSAGTRKDAVYTNTGLMFKFIYVDRCCEDTLTWSRQFPRYIVAVNKAYEFCDANNPCDLNHEWPRVTYDWPGNMPGALKINPESEFTVTDAIGRKTTFLHKRLDLYENFPPGEDGKHFVPRVVKVVDEIAGGGRVTEYFYENFYRDGNIYEPMSLTRVDSNGESWSYSIYNKCGSLGCTEFEKGSTGPLAIDFVSVNATKGVPTLVKLSDRTIEKGNSYSNPLRSITFKKGPRVTFGYDSRGRVMRRSSIDPTLELPALVTTAKYPDGCPNPKTCNQPEWVEDARGNRTDYTYHLESGQIESVRGPADEDGRRPHKQYYYQKLNAVFLNSSGNLVQGDGIWMLSEEVTCRNSEWANESCAGGDEIRTVYEYGSATSPRNLFVKGIAVSYDGKTRRTCFEHDIYGNVIGETQPRAGVASCQ